MKIAVLAGGLSSERNISLISGTNVCRALRERGHEAVVVDLFLGFEHVDCAPQDAFAAPDGLLSTITITREEPDLEAIRKGRKDKSGSIFGPGVLELCRLADVVFLALHGQCGEDGRIQAAFDLMGIPYTGAGYVSSALAMDKALTKVMMEAAGILTPRWQEFTYAQGDIPAICAKISCPCVVKAVTGGSSLGVQVVEEASALPEALKAVLKYGNHIVVEEKILGRELTCGVLGERYLPAVEILPDEAGYDYNNKYNGQTKELCPAPITEEEQRLLGETTLKLFHALGLSVYARADFLLTEDGKAYCLEINTLPGMTPTSLIPQEAAAVGISYGELCEEIITLSLNERGKG
jgi:D-alanine-D-alanine ligase